MKGIIISFVVVVISATIEIRGENECPQVIEDPLVDILFPHESDCSKFYKCSHGEPHELDCPGDLYFNPEENYCDWRFNVDCKNEDSSEEVGNGICPPIGKEPEDDILFPHDSDCTKFFKCSHGEIHEMNCPEKLYFNPDKNQCDWPDNVNCTSSVSSSEEGSGDISKEEDILLPHESDCSKFYKVSNGQKHELSCPDGLHFNPDNKQCDWPRNVNCTNNDNPKSKINETNDGNDCPKNAENSRVNVLLPHENDCSKYYICNHGEKVQMDCPNDLHFNPSKKYCDYPNIVNCKTF